MTTSKPINDGGAAFPGIALSMHEFTPDGKHVGSFPTKYAPGMSLRDCLAGMALQGVVTGSVIGHALIASGVKSRVIPLDEVEIASACYRIADSMLATSRKGRGEE